jgi:V/A-type H+-transporting ATPase subunit C
MESNFFLLLLLLILGFLLPFLIFLMRNLSNILPYLYATARIRAKEARLLKPETLDEMVNTGSVSEIASILENSEYGLAMQGLVLENSESIEDLLTRQTADVYSEIARMLPEKVQNVFSYLLQQWDVRNLKTILRGVRTGLSAEQILAKTVPFGEMDSELLKKMAESSSVEDLLPLFEGTCYGELATMLAAYDQDRSLLPLESALDRQLLGEMWNQVVADNRLQTLKPGLAASIDALNLKTLFRGKKDHLLLSDIENYLISGGDLHTTLLNVFDEVDEVTALVAELEGTAFFKPLMEMMPEYEKTGALFQLEKVLDETALWVGKETSIKQPYGIAPMLGYLSLKETEVRNIRAISRAKEAGLAPEQIRELVLSP